MAPGMACGFGTLFGSAANDKLRALGQKMTKNDKK
jgi:hypothetical protein